MPTITRLRDLKKEAKPNPSMKYYNNKGWRILRNSYIRNHPLCEMCLKEGKTTPAEHVHHKINFMSGNTEGERLHLLLSQDNLQSLCSLHHHQLHMQHK
jgi:5-methylcytosine-specific restriction protein A